jgi:hypothetical protein
MTLRIPTCYTVWSDYGLDMPVQRELYDFDTAVSIFGDEMALGRDSLVFRVEPVKGSKAPMMIDVTADAIACIARRERAKGPEMPGWLLDALDEPRPRDRWGEQADHQADMAKTEELERTFG